MGFFTTDFGLGEEYANPKVSQAYQPSGGGGATSPALTSRQAASDPLGQLAQAMSGNTSGGYGGSGTNSLTDIASMLAGSSNMAAGSSNMVGGGLGGFAPTSPITPINQTPISGDSGDDYSSGMLTGGTGGAFSPTAEDYQSYLSNRNWLQGAINMFIPTGNIAGAAMDYNMGINPTPFGPTFMQNYTGPGFSGEYTGGIMTASDQRDQLIEQISFDPEGASWFGGNFMGYDPDLDLSIGPWSETTPVDPNYNWGANANINPYTGQVMTQEYVVPNTQGTITPTGPTFGTNLPDVTAGGYTFGSDLYSSLAEAQDETGLGTAEWDTSHEDFSWDDSSSSDSGDGGWGDSDAASDMSEDSGWSGADSDFDDSSSDSGGGDSGGGGGGSYIATAATQALGEEGLKLFEDWRDYMFTALPTFTTSYGRYRVTAPKIVEAIDKKDNSKNIYSWIWDIHLKPIFDMIVEDKDSEKALKDYKIMVKDLQNKFLKEKR
jgi:hypothetical protein